MSDTMHIAYNLNMRYTDAFQPKINPEEIVEDVMAKGGLSFG